MPPKPSITRAFGLPRSILLPGSFAACAVLLALLFVTLVSCAQFAGLDETYIAKPNDHNAVLCSCDCEGAVEPVPSANPIRAGADDATQALGQGEATLTSPALVLGQGGFVGLRFQNFGVPPKATINSAYIQFSATEKDSGTADLEIRVVNSPDAPAFTAATDLSGIVDFIGPAPWTPAAWTAANERGDAEKTADVAALLQPIVNDAGYSVDSAVAFIITGSGRRSARAFEGQTPGGRPAALTVTYTPRTITQDFLACGNVSTDADRQNVCQNLVQSNVTSIAQQCKLANACTCTVKPVPDSDTTTFSAVCNSTCPKIVAPDDCDPDLIAQTTAATDSHTPVCVANSPLGSVLFGQLSVCDLDRSQSTVTVRVFDDDDSVTKVTNARGRVEFSGPPCPGGSCFVGVKHRTKMDDITFNGGLFSSDHTLTDLSAVGASESDSFVDNGAGIFAALTTNHSVRGHEVDGDTVAIYKPADKDIAYSVGDWQPGATCTLQGMLFQGDHLEVSADFKGTLVNQPPSADAGPDRTVECNTAGRGFFTLEASVHDPDNNVASIGWFRGSRKGPVVGTLPAVELDQPVTTPTSNNATQYVFKVIDAFGQYDEDTTNVAVVDTTAPVVTAPSDRTAECTGPSGTPVDIGNATAADVCDASPRIANNAPQLFALGDTTITWTGTDESGNVGSADQHVKIVDTTPPDLAVAVSPAVLWPPDHKLVPITATITVTDTCDPNPIIQLVSITSSEPGNGLGDGDTAADIQGASPGTDDRQFVLRAERSGSGNGRVYTITYKATDHSGNSTVRTATVTVPKSQTAR